MNLIQPLGVPLKKTDPVARSMAKPDACAKPCNINASRGVRVRVNMGKVNIRRKKRNHDPRDVTFY